MSQIQGMDQLLKKLQGMKDTARGETMKLAVIAGALEISNSAKQKAPWITGTLRRSIHVGGFVSESSPDFTPHDVGGDYTDVGGQEITEDSASVLIGTNLIYAAAQEFGYPPKNIPAQPYLRPAWDEQLPNAIKKIKSTLAGLIKKATG